MADINSPSRSFLATNTATYPLVDTIDGTTTAASSETILVSNITLESVVIEAFGGADGTVTVKDHAGSKTITLPIVALAPRDFHYGPYGMRLHGWKGIQAVCSDAAAKARVVFRFA